MRHFTYIVECRDGSLYTGYTTNLARRIDEHNGVGTAKKVGAKYTKARRPVSLVYSQYFLSRSKAQQREAEIKQLSKTEKLELIRSKQITS